MNRLYKFVIYSIGIIAQLTARSAGIGLPDFFEDKVFSFWLGVNPNEINIPEHYSPAWGAIMKASGFLNNLRFFGNYDKSTVERMNEAGDVTFTDRRYDAGRDNIMKLIIQLFPSNTADHVDCLESVWNSPRNLGHFFQQRLESDKPQTLRHLAGLMLRAEVFRLSLNGQNPFIPAIPAIAHPKPVHSFFQKSYKINPPAWAHLGDISDQERDFLTDNFQYLLNKRMGIKGFNTLLVNALQDETSAGYQQYTVEHSLLAFIFDVVRNKDDAQLLLREWSGLRANIFTREYIGEQQYLQFSSRQGLTNLAQEVFTNLIRLLHGFPYQAPVSDGKATQWIVYPDGSTVALGNFSDCIETSIRHLFNYSLGCSGMHSFDKEAIRARVKAMFPNEGQLRGDDHLDEIETFYQTIHDPNDIGHATRSLWNLVTFGLNSADEMQSPHCVRYELTRDLPNSGNELLSNICNVLKAVGGILGIRASTIMEGVDNLDDVLVKLNDLLSLINDSNTYDLHVVQSNIGDDISVDSIYAEIAIDIGVLSKNRTFDDGYYVFTLNSIPGHGFVSLPNRQIASLTNTTVNDIERNVFSYFFDEYPGQSPYSHIFALPSLGNFETILTKAVQVYENTSDTNLRTSFHSVFEKVAARMSLTDFGVASYLYESIIMASLFNNTTYQSVRHAIHDPVTLPPDLRHVILEIDAADVPLFDMSHNNGFTISLDLNGEITQVLREGRIPNYLKALKFTTHAAIDELDLSNFSELTSLEVYCESLNGFKPPKNGQLKSYIFNNTVYQI